MDAKDEAEFREAFNHLVRGLARHGRELYKVLEDEVVKMGSEDGEVLEEAGLWFEDLSDDMRK